MRLKLAHPEFDALDCQICLKHLVDYETGCPVRQPGSGALIVRAKSSVPLCRQISKEFPEGRCPKGSPEKPRALSRDNKKALIFHRVCKATGIWPDDEQVFRSAEIIEHLTAEQEATDRWLQGKMLNLNLKTLTAMIGASTPKLR